MPTSRWWVGKVVIALALTEAACRPKGARSRPKIAEVERGTCWLMPQHEDANQESDHVKRWPNVANATDASITNNAFGGAVLFPILGRSTLVWDLLLCAKDFTAARLCELSRLV